MHIEYEVKILEIDAEKFKKKIENLGAKLIGKFEQKRYTYDFNPITKGKWIRLRTNGYKTTLAIKHVKNYSINRTKELEVEVSNFEETNEILEILGYEYRNYQENNRIQYRLDDVEINIDSWPLIPTYAEIEGKSEDAVKKCLKLLDIDTDRVISMDLVSIYNKKYGINIIDMETLKF
ncbi:MAG: CYTH domain-containing protein [Clostridia bacterium]